MMIDVKVKENCAEKARKKIKESCIDSIKNIHLDTSDDTDAYDCLSIAINIVGTKEKKIIEAIKNMKIKGFHGVGRKVN